MSKSEIMKKHIAEYNKLNKALGGSINSRRAAHKDLKGVHTPGGFSGLEEKGQSQAGRNIQRAKEPQPNKHMSDLYHGRGKQMHEDKLAEMKAMPKPNLPKSELDKTDFTNARAVARVDRKEMEPVNPKDVPPPKVSMKKADEKGVHPRASGSHQLKGQSPSGRHIRGGLGEKDYKAQAQQDVKSLHHKVIAEQKAMPKPNLPKSEVQKTDPQTKLPGVMLQKEGEKQPKVGDIGKDGLVTLKVGAPQAKPASMELQNSRLKTMISQSKKPLTKDGDMGDSGSDMGGQSLMESEDKMGKLKGWLKKCSMDKTLTASEHGVPGKNRPTHSRGINETVSISNDPQAHEKSLQGLRVRRGDMSGAKSAAKEILAEQKAMPKPNLPKSEDMKKAIGSKIDTSPEAKAKHLARWKANRPLEPGSRDKKNIKGVHVSHFGSNGGTSNMGLHSNDQTRKQHVQRVMAESKAMPKPNLPKSEPDKTSGLNSMKPVSNMQKAHVGFDKLKNQLAHEKHPPANPAAVAAKIGMEKYGKKAFEAKAAAGHKKMEKGQNEGKHANNHIHNYDDMTSVKGVHQVVPVYDRTNGKLEHGRSDAGQKARQVSSGRGTQAISGEHAKQSHKKVLGEMKAMPKPNLPKSEPDKTSGLNTMKPVSNKSSSTMMKSEMMKKHVSEYKKFSKK
jgi:hypothetical protein